MKSLHRSGIAAVLVAVRVPSGCVGGLRDDRGGRGHDGGSSQRGGAHDNNDGGGDRNPTPH
jgi:hypothetical protein